MRRNKRTTFRSGLLANLILILILAITGTSIVQAQDKEQVYYFQTGHFISGSFLTYYQSLPNAAYTLGYPITEDFFDPFTGHNVQYFQRGRLEYEPLNPPGQQVFRTAIGQTIFERHTPEKISVTEQDCHRELHWQYPVCLDFLDLFNLYGGEFSFGVPISGFVIENGRMVQYFTYARIEWHPDDPSGPMVTLADLGYIFFTDIMEEDVSLLDPVKEDNIIQQVTTLQVYAFTEKAIIKSGNLQAVYIAVHDQSALPVENTRIIIDIRLPDGQQLQYTRMTNANGIAKLPLKIEAQDIGLVEINITAIYNKLDPEYTLTSFRIWY